MRLGLVLIAAGVAALAGPAAAQSWNGYSQPRYDADVRAQMDRPGDYRCDAYWDANRTDCGAAWRDQRSRTSYNSYGYGQGRSNYDHGRGGFDHGHGYNERRRGYGSRYNAAQGGTAYYGSYGRPDLVYPNGGQSRGGHGYNPGYSSGYNSNYGGYAQGGRDSHRIDWCRATYRSYDPSSGYYRAYSGRLVYCG